MRGSDWKKRKEDTNSQCQSHTVNVHNSPTHLSSSSSSSFSVSPYAEFCDHSTWRRKNKSHRSVEGRSRFGVEARMNIKIRGRASILHGCTSNLQTSTRSLTCPGRKREENSGIRGAFSCKSGQRGPLFSAARLCATDIATNFSLRPKLLYTPRGWFTTFRPLVIHRPTMEPGTDRGRRFRGEIAFHAVRSSSILFEADPPRRGVDASAWNSSHFRWKYLRKHLAPNWKLSSFPDRWLPGRTFYRGKKRRAITFLELALFEASLNFLRLGRRSVYCSGLISLFHFWKKEWKAIFQKCLNNGFNCQLDNTYVTFLRGVSIETSKKKERKRKFLRGGFRISIIITERFIAIDAKSSSRSNFPFRTGR